MSVQKVQSIQKKLRRAILTDMVAVVIWAAGVSTGLIGFISL